MHRHFTFLFSIIMTRQEQFDSSAREAERISAKIYKLYCGACDANDSEEEQFFLESRTKLDISLEALKEQKQELARVDEDDLSNSDLVEFNNKINSLLRKIEELSEENREFLYNY